MLKETGGLERGFPVASTLTLIIGTHKKELVDTPNSLGPQTAQTARAFSACRAP